MLHPNGTNTNRPSIKKPMGNAGYKYMLTLDRLDAILGALGRELEDSVGAWDPYLVGWD